jgi:hypothetical protein
VGEEKFNQIENLINDRLVSITVVDFNGKEINLGVE